MKKRSKVKSKTLVTVNAKGTFLRIYINDLLHMAFNIYDVRGIEANINTTQWYCINVYVDNCKIPYEYSNRELWTEVLKILDQYLP